MRVVPTPSISVVVPAYNVSPWIAETLESVLAQTSPPDEVVVVDDGSSDDLAAAIAPYRGDVRFFAQQNAGCGAAFNRGIREARGEYVALCPADDVWVPEKLEWQRETLRSGPAVDVSFGRAVNFGQATHPAPAPTRDGLQPLHRLRREMFVQNVIPDPSVVVRRALVTDLGGFVAEIGEDYEFWFRAMAAGAVFHADPRVLVRLRQRGSNLSQNAVAIWGMMVAVHRQHADALDDPELVAHVLARDLRRLGRSRAGIGDATGASRAYAEAWRRQGRAADLLRAATLGLPGLDTAARSVYGRRRRSAGR